MGSGKEYCHGLHSSGKPTLRCRFAHRRFVGEWLQGSLLWGSEENRIRQREKLKFNAVTTVAPDHPTRSSGASELSSVEAKGSDLYLSKLTSHWTYAIPGKGACPWADDFLWQREISGEGLIVLQSVANTSRAGKWALQS